MGSEIEKYKKDDDEVETEKDDDVVETDPV
jgi:hypothetical protein